MFPRDFKSRTLNSRAVQSFAENPYFFALYVSYLVVYIILNTLFLKAHHNASGYLRNTIYDCATRTTC